MSTATRPPFHRPRTRTRRTTRWATATSGAAVAAAALLVLSACGSNSGYGGSPSSSANTPTTSSGGSQGGAYGGAYGGGRGGGYGSTTSPSQRPATSAAGSVGTGHTSAGTVLVDAHGMTLYAFAADTRGHSNCTGSCATYWPPVPASEAPTHAPHGVSATFGSTTRSDGSSQLTVDGYPMYTYSGDSAPGDAGGQGLNLSGGLWWVVAPDGTWITH